MKPSFAPFETKMRAENLPQIAIDTFRHYFELLLDGETGTLAEAAIDPVVEVPGSEELTGYADRGEGALAHTVVLKLNGGLGTSMGMQKAKSLLPVKQGRSFLDLIAEQVLHLRRRHECSLPLVLMNSFRTREDSLAALARYPELATDLPLDFVQHKVPKIRRDDYTPVEWPENPEHEWCPPGHGDLYTAIVTSGMLAQLIERGYRYAFVSNSDNLGAVLEPSILGWFAEEEIPFLMEVCDRTEADRKGGHLARLESGELVLREVAQCPPDELELFQDVSRHRYFNTNTLWLNLNALAETLAARNDILGLPMIRNVKTVDPKLATSPAVFQLETAMGAAISVFPEARAIRVPRERFVPVKTTNDLLVLWSDAYTVTEDHRVARSGGTEDLVVDLDPEFYRRIDQLEERFPEGAPSLVDCRRLEIRGDLRFGKRVVCRGDVRLAHSGAEPRVVADDEVLD